MPKEIGTEAAVISTGGEVDGMVMALIETTFDKDESCRGAIKESLQDIGYKQSALVLSSCEWYLTKHKKLVMGHRVALLQIMTSVAARTLDELSAELALRLVKLGVTEMTFKQEIVPEWQEAASQLVVAIGAKYGRIVLDELTARFAPGQIPHYFVIKTLGEFAQNNVFVTVPALEEIIGRSLPMLGMVKHDNMRWVFAQAFARFCDAILSYIANIERASDKSITINKFSQQIYSAFEVMFNVWLNAKEARLRLAVVEALGLMAQILTREKLEMMLPRLVPGMLVLYKKFTSDTLPLTMGFERVLAAGIRDGDELLAPHFDLIVSTLYPLLQYTPNYDDSMAIKNYNELLRCFERLCDAFSDQLMAFLFLKMETKDDRGRTGALNVLKHLVNSSEKALSDKRALVVTGLRPLLEDPSLMVKQALAQLIIALAHHDYLRLEGGEVLVQFIVTQCAILPTAQPPQTKKRKGEDDVCTPLQLRSMCDSILHLCTTTIPCMELVMWPFLLEFIVPRQYEEALPTVCMSLATLGNRFIESESDSYDIDYEELVNLPTPHATIARLLVVAGHPLYRNRGVHILSLLLAMSANLHESIEDMWDDVIPKLIAYLKKHQQNEEEWKQQAWEDLLLRLLSRTLDDIDDEEWILKLGEALGQHFDLYMGNENLKNMCSKSLGVVLKKLTKKDFIVDHLQLIFSKVDHTSQVEREGCARAFGFAASSHLDQVVERLGLIAKTDMVRRGSGFMGLVKDKSEADVSRIKATLMLCYGFVTLYSPPSLITSRVEVNILASINPHFKNVRDPMVKENLIRCVDLIGKSLHPSHLKVETFTFHRRGDLLGHMQAYMRTESMSGIATETRALAIDACTTLITLAPKLSDADLFQLVDTATMCVFELPRISEENEAQVKLFDQSLRSVNALLAEAVSKDTTAECLQSLFKHLSKWICSPHEHQRERMMRSYLELLTAYHTSLTQALEAGETKSKFNLDGLGKFLADLVPRCTDPLLSVRQHALGCVQVLLRIQEAYAGNTDKDVMVEAVTKLQERTEKKEAKEQFAVVNDLAKVFGRKIAKEELLQFTYPLFEGLLDRQADSASGACVVLNGLFRLRGQELAEEVDAIIEALHEKMTMVADERTGTGILRAIRTLAAHHLPLVIKKLLSFELPYDKHVVDTWHTLSTDPALAPRILVELLDILNTSQPYEVRDVKKGVTQKLLTMPPMKATCALRELCVVEETEALVLENYPAIFAATLTRIGSCASIDAPKKGPQPILDAIDAFKEFLTRADSTFMFDTLDEDDVWAKFETEAECPEALTTAAAAICKHAPEHVAELVELFEPILKRVYESQRMVAAAVYSEFIEQGCGGDLSHINRLKNGLLSKLVDPFHMVRMLCIRGLGNIASIPDEHMKMHSTTVLSAMMTGMDDRDDPMDDITLEAMRGLSKILPKLEEDNVRSILINISLRIRPCFEKEKEKVRAAAILLFGNLSRFGDGPSRLPFLEQIHSNLVSLLVHLNDPEDVVRDACKSSLKLVAGILECQPISDMFVQHLHEGKGIHYGEFINDLTKIMLEAYPDKVNFYTMNSLNFFKSEWSEIRANAAMFVGFLLGNLGVADRKSVTKEHVCGELIRLLKDPSSSVRQSAAEAMSQLFDY